MRVPGLLVGNSHPWQSRTNPCLGCSTFPIKSGIFAEVPRPSDVHGYLSARRPLSERPQRDKSITQSLQTLEACCLKKAAHCMSLAAFELA